MTSYNQSRYIVQFMFNFNNGGFMGFGTVFIDKFLAKFYTRKLDLYDCKMHAFKTFSTFDTQDPTQCKQLITVCKALYLFRISYSKDLQNFCNVVSSILACSLFIFKTPVYKLFATYLIIFLQHEMAYQTTKLLHIQLRYKNLKGNRMKLFK